MKQKMVLLLSLFLSTAAGAKCRELVKIHGTLDPVKNTWSDSEIETGKKSVCVSTDDTFANLELTFKKGKDQFTAKIFSSLDGFYDVQDKNKKMTGGKYEINQVFIDSWAPTWAKGSTLTITEMTSKKKLVETKL